MLNNDEIPKNCKKGKHEWQDRNKVVGLTDGEKWIVKICKHCYYAEKLKKVEG